MWDGFKLWLDLFFDSGDGGVYSSRRDHSQNIINIFNSNKRYIKLLGKISKQLEETTVTEDQLLAIFGYEATYEVLEAEIEDWQAGKRDNINLMEAWHLLLNSCIHLYSFGLAYHDGLEQVEVAEVHKCGFEFHIRKMKWWL